MTEETRNAIAVCRRVWSETTLDDFEQDALDTLIRSVEANDWIPVAERLPENGHTKLITYRGPDGLATEYGRYSNDEWLWSDGVRSRVEVMAWCEMPQPYLPSDFGGTEGVRLAKFDPGHYPEDARIAELTAENERLKGEVAEYEAMFEKCKYAGINFADGVNIDRYRREYICASKPVGGEPNQTVFTSILEAYRWTQEKKEC